MLLILALPVVADAARRVEWRSLDRVDRALWALLGVALLGSQSMSVALPGLPVLGYQGAAFLAIVLGYCRAILSLAIVLALTVPLLHWGGAMLVDALLPVWCIGALVSLTRRFAPPNLFVFLLGPGFFGLFAVGALQLAAGFALDRLGAGDVVVAGGFAEAFGYGLLLLAGEATLAGMVISVLVVYLPRSVALFDEAHYLSAGKSM